MSSRFVLVHFRLFWCSVSHEYFTWPCIDHGRSILASGVFWALVQQGSGGDEGGIMDAGGAGIVAVRSCSGAVRIMDVSAITHDRNDKDKCLMIMEK